MSAKAKLREDAAKFKALAARIDAERLQYAHMLIAVLNKMGGSVVVTADNMRAFTEKHAIQADRLPDGGAHIRVLVKKPEVPRG